jgi:hypothetical protein
MKLFAVHARHISTSKSVCFLVVSDTQDKAGWPLLGTYQKFDLNFFPESFQFICDASGKTSEVIGYFGPQELEPNKK